MKRSVLAGLLFAGAAVPLTFVQMFFEIRSANPPSLVDFLWVATKLLLLYAFACAIEDERVVSAVLGEKHIDRTSH